jgi:hypothetical protein
VPLSRYFSKKKGTWRLNILKLRFKQTKEWFRLNLFFYLNKDTLFSRT